MPKGHCLPFDLSISASDLILEYVMFVETQVSIGSQYCIIFSSIPDLHLFLNLGFGEHFLIQTCFHEEKETRFLVNSNKVKRKEKKNSEVKTFGTI